LHVDLALVGNTASPVTEHLEGGSGLEDGFEFVRDAMVERVPVGRTVESRAAAGDGHQLTLWARSSSECEWWRAVAPAAPGRGDAAFRMLRARGRSGAHVLVWSWSGGVASVSLDHEIRIQLTDGSVHQHREADEGWHVELHAGSARSGIDLGGWTPTSTATSPAVVTVRAAKPIELPASGRLVEFRLGEPHYRRSEPSWAEAGGPGAAISLRWCAPVLELTIDVARSDRTFTPATAVNRYDNEPADVNGDGVQLYVRTDRGESGWMLVPETSPATVRMRQLDGWAAPLPIRAEWRPSETGYRMRVSVETSTPPRAIDAIVNEMPAGRERRRGQLVMSGANGEFVYLRGDRHGAEHLIPIRVVDD
jgi:hypothetical protein